MVCAMQRSAWVLTVSRAVKTTTGSADSEEDTQTFCRVDSFLEADTCTAGAPRSIWIFILILVSVSLYTNTS